MVNIFISILFFCSFLAFVVLKSIGKPNIYKNVYWYCYKNTYLKIYDSIISMLYLYFPTIRLISFFSLYIFITDLFCNVNFFVYLHRTSLTFLTSDVIFKIFTWISKQNGDDPFLVCYHRLDIKPIIRFIANTSSFREVLLSPLTDK